MNFNVLSSAVFDGGSGGVGSRPDASGVDSYGIVSQMGKS